MSETERYTAREHALLLAARELVADARDQHRDDCFDDLVDEQFVERLRKAIEAYAGDPIGDDEGRNQMTELDKFLEDLAKCATALEGIDRVLAPSRRVDAAALMARLGVPIEDVPIEENARHMVLEAAVSVVANSWVDHDSEARAYYGVELEHMKKLMTALTKLRKVAPSEVPSDLALVTEEDEEDEDV